MTKIIIKTITESPNYCNSLHELDETEMYMCFARNDIEMIIHDALEHNCTPNKTELKALFDDLEKYAVRAADLRLLLTQKNGE